MAEHDHDFDPVRLDQQIEHPADSLNVENRQLVEDLQQMGRPTRSESLANAQSLQRVQERLQARLTRENQETKVVPLSILHTASQKGKSLMIDKAGKRKPGWQRFSRALNTLAAVLTLAVLVGSITVVFAIRRNGQGGNPSIVAPSSQVTATPLPNLDCSHVFGYPFSGSYPDNGEHAVCLQHLETALQGSTTINDHKLTLISAYADANRLLIEYAVSGKTTDSELVSIDTLTIQDGTQTLTPDIALDFQVGGGYYYDQVNDQTFFLDSYSTQQVSAHAKQLQVTADFQAFVSPGPLNAQGTNDDQTSFTFTVPMQTAKRIATPNQSVVISGHRLTLTQIVVTASATYLSVKPEPSIPGYPMEVLTATVNGNSPVDAIEPTTDGKVNGKWDPITNLSLEVPENWLTRSASWTLSLQSNATPSLGAGSGEIQFTVPG